MSAVAPLPKSPFRNDILSGRVVLITGGATGIGYACADAFGKHGAKVAILARRKHVIDEAVELLKAEGIHAYGIVGDVRDYEKCVVAVNTVADHFGRIDFLINNAAGNFMVSAENLSANGLATVLGIDLQGCFHMSKAVLPHMKKVGPSDGACIINITAFLQDKATPFQAHAASAKAGIDVLTNTLGVEWGEYGIRTIGLAPGGISGTVGGPGGRVFGRSISGKQDTGTEAGSVKESDIQDPPPDELQKRGVPAGRWGRVDDVALAAVYMCSSAAGWITATRLTIDGGSCHKTSGFIQQKQMIEQVSAEQKKTFKGKGGAAQSKL